MATCVKGKKESPNQGEDRFRLLFNYVGDALFLHDLEGRFVEVNQAACDSLGYTREELLRLPLSSIVKNWQPNSLKGLWSKVIGGEKLIVQGAHRRKDGATFPVEVHLGPFEYGGRPHILASARDITDRKRAEAALAESEQRFSTFMDHLPATAFIKDQAGRLVFANRYLQETFGWEDFLGKTTAELLPPELAAGMVEDDRRALSEGPLVIQEKIIDAQGEERFFDTYKFPVTAEGAPSLVGGIAVEVTARKQAEEALRESREYLETVMESVGAGIMVVDAETRQIVDINPFAEKIIGVPKEKIIGKICHEHICPAEIGKCPVMDLGLTVDQSERSLLTGRGQTIPILKTVTQFQKEGRKYLLESFLDITERKQTDEALRESEARFRQVVEYSPLPIGLAAPGGKIEYVNPKFLETFGYTLEDIPHLADWFRLAYPDPSYRQKVISKWQEGLEKIALDNRANEPREVEITCKDGSKRVMEVFGALLGDKTLSIFHDLTERKRAEEALRESEEQLRLALQAANQGIYDLNIQTGEIKVTPEYATMLGYDPAAFQETSARWIESLHPDDRQGVEATYLAYARGDIPDFAVEFRQRTKSGDWKWILSLGKIVAWDEDGKPLRMLGTNTDITQRKQMEESLIRTQFAVDRARDAVFWVKADGGLAYVNQAACDSLGYASEELLTLSIFDIDSQFPQEQWPEHWQRSRELGSFEIETLHRTKGGRIFPVEIAINFIKFDGEEYHCAFARDISERKRTEEALRNSERRLSEIFDFLPDATFAIDLQGKVIAWNRAIEEMTGVQAEEIIGKGDYEYALPFYGIRRPILIDLVFKSDAEIEKKYAFVKKEGDIRWAEAEVPLKGEKHFLWGKARPLYDSEGNIAGAIETIRDISERQRAEEERAKMEAQMREVQKLESLGVLAGGIAHDFNNLLMAVLGNADLALLFLSPASPARPHVEEIARASQRAADLCRQMLAYSGKGRFVVGRYDLSEIVQEMTQMLEVSVSKKATLRYSFGAKLPPVEADATQLRQVIMNLITNASEALGDKSGYISVSTGVMDCDRTYLAESYLDDKLPEGRYVYLEVADTGCGMDEESRRRIFDPFFTTKFMGRGLGLAAVLGIVRGHHGAIKVYSEPGQGTTFKILLPAGEWKPGDRAASETPSPPTLRAGTILLIDDDPDVRLVGSQMLERLGFAVLTATHGPQGLEIFRDCGDEIDCVLLDLTMPEMGGDEVFRELRRLRNDVCVIISSGYHEQDVTQRFAGKGLAGFIQKPYTVAKLREILNRVLES